MLLRDHGSDYITHRGSKHDYLGWETTEEVAIWYAEALNPFSILNPSVKGLAQKATVGGVFITAAYLTNFIGTGNNFRLSYLIGFKGEKLRRYGRFGLWLAEGAVANQALLIPAAALVTSAIISYEIGEDISQLPGHSGTSSQTNVANIWAGGGSMSGGTMPSVPYDSSHKQGQADMSEIFTWEFWSS